MNKIQELIPESKQSEIIKNLRTASPDRLERFVNYYKYSAEKHSIPKEDQIEFLENNISNDMLLLANIAFAAGEDGLSEEYLYKELNDAKNPRHTAVSKLLNKLAKRELETTKEALKNAKCKLIENKYRKILLSAIGGLLFVGGVVTGMKSSFSKFQNQKEEPMKLVKKSEENNDLLEKKVNLLEEQKNLLKTSSNQWENALNASQEVSDSLQNIINTTPKVVAKGEVPQGWFVDGKMTIPDSSGTVLVVRVSEADGSRAIKSGVFVNGKKLPSDKVSTLEDSQNSDEFIVAEINGKRVNETFNLPDNPGYYYYSVEGL